MGMVYLAILTCLSVLATTVSTAAAQEQPPVESPESATSELDPPPPDLGAFGLGDVLAEIPDEDLAALESAFEDDVDLFGEQTSEAVHLDIALDTNAGDGDDFGAIDPGESFAVTFDVSAIGTGDLTKSIAVEVFLPQDIWLASLDTGTSNWTCSEVDSASTAADTATAQDVEHELTCESGLDLSQDEATSFSLTLEADPDSSGDEAHVIRAAASVPDALSPEKSEASVIVKLTHAPEPWPHMELLRTGPDEIHEGGVLISVHEPEPVELLVTNVGSAPLDADEPVTVTVTGVQTPVSAAEEGPWTCEQADTTLTCQIDLASDLDLDAELESLVLDVSAHDSDAGRVDEWSATTLFGIPKPPQFNSEGEEISPVVAEPLDFEVEYILERPETLAVLELVEVPREGGHGQFALRLSDHGDHVDNTTVVIAAPTGVAFGGFDGDGWSCAAAGPTRLGQLATCVLPTDGSSSELPGSELLVDFTLDHTAEEGSDFLAYVRSDHETESENNLHTMHLHILGDLHPYLGPDITVADQVDGDGLRPSVELHAVVEHETGVSFTWSQVCGASDGIAAGCNAGSPSIDFETLAEDSRTQFVVPDGAEELTVRVTARDGLHREHDDIVITVIDQEQFLDDIAGIAHEPPTWDTISVAADGDVVFGVQTAFQVDAGEDQDDVEDSDEEQDDEIDDSDADDAGDFEPVEPEPEPSVPVLTPSRSGAPEIVCTVIEALNSGQSPTELPLGAGAVVRFGVTRVTGDCDSASASVTFSETTVELLDGISISGAGGELSASGLTLGEGTMDLPGSLELPSFSLPSDLTASLGAAGSTLQPLTGSLEINSAPFLDLNGWDETTTFDFLPTPVGRQGIELNATANDGNGALFVIDGELGAGQGSIFNVSVTGLVEIQGKSINLDGQIDTSQEGSPEYLVHGALEGSVSVADGVSIDSLDVQYTPDGVVGNGELAVGDAKLTTSLVYTSTDDWVLTVASAQDWEVVGGLVVKAGDVNGHITQTPEKLTVDVNASVDENWSPLGAISIGPTLVTLGNNCEGASECPVLLTLNAPGTLELLETIPFVLDGQVELATGSVNIDIPITRSINVYDGFSLSSPDINIDLGLDRFDFTLTGDASIGGFTAPASIGFLPDGWVATGHVSESTTIAGFDLPTLSFAMASFDTTINARDFEIDVPRSVSGIDLKPFALTGFSAMSLPNIGLPSGGGGGSNSGNSGGTSGPGFPQLPSIGLARIDLGASIRGIDLAVPTPDNWFLFGGPGSGSGNGSSSLRLTDIDFSFTPLDTGVAMSLIGQSELTFNGDSVLLEGELGIDAGVTPGLHGKLGLKAEEGWNNAFGVDGLTVQNLALQLDVGAGGAAVGVFASGQLPASIANPLGMDARTTVTVAASLGSAMSCFYLDLEAPEGAHAINLGDGVVQAQHAKIGIAPAGCSIGPADTGFELQPGFTLLFDGEILETPVLVDATWTSAPEFSIHAKTHVGAMDLGGVELDHTDIEIDVEPGSWRVSFDTSVHFGETEVDVDALASSDGSGAMVEFHGSIDQLEIGVAEIEDVSLGVEVSVGDEVSASFSVEGMISTLGTRTAIRLDARMRDGIIQTASGELDANVPIAGTDLSGTLMFDYVFPHAPEIEGEIDLTVDGFKLGGAHARVGESGVEIDGSIDGGLLGHVVLSGRMVFESGGDAEPIEVRNASGQSVVGNAGDFSMFAETSLDLGGFSSNGEVSFGSIGGEAYLQFDGHSNLGGRFNVNFDGAISSNGDFQFEGDGSLRYGEWTLNIVLQASQQQGNVDFAFETELKTVVATVDVAGSVTRNNKGTSYRLTGRETIDLGFINEEAEFVWTNETLVAHVSLKAGSTVDVSGTLSITTPGSFSFSAKAVVSVAGVRPELTVSLNNCGSTCSQHTKNFKIEIHGKLKVSGVNFSLDTKIDTAGKFSAKVSTKGSFRGDSRFIILFRTGISWDISVTVNERGFQSLRAQGRGNVDYKIDRFPLYQRSFHHLMGFDFHGSVNSSGRVHGSVRVKIGKFGGTVHV